MFAVILSEDDAFYRSVAHRSRLHNYSVARYRDPVKLADNLPELRPERVVIGIIDYPLHWEMLASQLLCMKNLSATRIVLFLPENLSPSHGWPNVNLLLEPAGRGTGSALSEKTSKEFSALLSPGRTTGRGHDSAGASSSSTPVSGLTSSRLMRAAGKSSSAKVNNL